MLCESESLNERTQWKKVKSSFSQDPRYKAVESSGLREEYFNEYVKTLAGKVSVCACACVYVYMCVCHYYIARYGPFKNVPLIIGGQSGANSCTEFT